MEEPEFEDPIELVLLDLVYIFKSIIFTNNKLYFLVLTKYCNFFINSTEFLNIYKLILI